MGLFDGIVKKKPPPTEQEMRKRERHQKEISAYRYVRNTVDRGAQQYCLNGDTTELAKVMSEEMIDLYTQELDTYMQHGLRWDFSTRYRSGEDPLSSDPAIEILTEDLDPATGKARGFTVREYYYDRSRAGGLKDNTVIAQADGARLGVVVKIAYLGGSSYRVEDIMAIPGV
jgi:hypothetical protein